MPAVQIDVKEPHVEVTKPRSREEHALPWGMYINQKDIDTHGATPNCPGCHAIRMGKIQCHTTRGAGRRYRRRSPSQRPDSDEYKQPTIDRRPSSPRQSRSPTR